MKDLKKPVRPANFVAMSRDVNCLTAGGRMTAAVDFSATSGTVREKSSGAEETRICRFHVWTEQQETKDQEQRIVAGDVIGLVRMRVQNPVYPSSPC